MEDRPKVSIVMPVYNGGAYLEPALQSALAQTYDPIEIVLVNDGSNDGNHTAAICERYADRDHRIKYLSQDNKGVAGALNAAVQAMEGDVFTWLSHDDLFEPHKTARQVEYFRRIGRRDAILFSDWTAIGPRGEKLQEITLDHQELVSNPRLAILHARVNGVTLFIPRFIVAELGGFDERYRYVQDYELWRRAIDRYDFYHQPEKLVRYRFHPGQDTLKPAAVAEGNKLWVRIVDQVEPVERAQVFGSSYCFYDRMSSFLSTTPYSEAAEHARRRSGEAVRETSIDVAVLASDEFGVQDTLTSLLLQVGLTPRIVVVSTTPQPLRADEAALCLHCPGATDTEAIASALAQTIGEYFAILRAGSTVAEDGLIDVVTNLQREGRMIDRAEALSTAKDADISTATDLDGLVFHRAFGLSAGFGCIPDAELRLNLSSRRDEVLRPRSLR